MCPRLSRATDPRVAGALALLLFLGGCATPQPSFRESEDLCALFQGYPDWYKEAGRSSDRWNIPVPVMMAILYQESSYKSDAQPPRTTCLWIFPGPRPSTAYGYAQAKDETWEDYIKASGNRGADRDDFGDAIDFVGWYCDRSARQCGIARNDAEALYLAYHEGPKGYTRRTYRGKTWVLGAAAKVKKRAQAYTSQLKRCEGRVRR